MAIDHDNLERDAHLARLLEAAAREEPPVALDATIQAAARREVNARPQAAGQVAGGGGGEACLPPLRAKRNWYVPVSIAAVLVMSASLVTIVQQEKGDELVQPPRSAPASAPAPAAASVPEQKSKEATQDAVASAQSESALRDAEPAKLKSEAARRADVAAASAPAADSADGYAAKLRKQADKRVDDRGENRSKASGPMESGVEQDRRESGVGSSTDRPAPVTAPTVALPEALKSGPAPGAALGGASGAAAPAVPSAPVRQARPEPFPAAAEQAPVQAKRDTAPVPPSPPVSSIASSPRTAAMAEDALASRNPPPTLEGRISAVPRPAAKPASAPTLQRSSPPLAPRPAWLSELDNQSPEKWLARLAEFKRDGRATEADELMLEFRRRFPDHPASAR